MLDQLDSISRSSIYLVPWTTFVLGILGSFHCAAMCGGLVVTCTPSKKNNIFYQFGRLSSYIILAVVSGLMGHLLSLDDTSSNLSLYFGVLIGIIFIFFGLSNYFTQVRAPKWLSKNILNLWHRLLPKNQKQVSLRSSFAVGAFSIFLPCGLLYGVLLSVASVQSPLISVISIFTFWLGTLPVMGFLSNFIASNIKPIARRLPLLTSSFLVLVGIMTIYNRIEVILLSIKNCH